MNNKTGLHFLIRRIADGDVPAQAEFHDLTYATLIQYVTGQFGSSLTEEDINEVVRQSILQMFLHATGYRGKHEDLSAWKWVYEIGRNQALKWIKAGKREITFSDTRDDSFDAEDQQIHRMICRFNPHLEPDSVEDQVVERMFRETAMEIVRLLDAREKLILSLHFEKDWTFKQIAAHLRVTPARITQIMKGIQRKCLSAAD